MLIYILFIAVFMRCFLLMVFMYTKNYTIKDSGLIEYDQYIYYNSAVNLSKGKGYTISFTDQEQQGQIHDAFKPSSIPNTYYNNFFPPVYPFFLSILFYFFGTSILVYAVPQIILGTVSCYLTYHIAREAFSSKIGLMACFLLAIYQPIAWWVSYVRTENLFIPLQLIAIIFLIKAIKNNLDVKNIALSGVFLAVSFLCRNTILYLPIFVAIYFFVIFFRVGIKRLIYCTTILLLSFYIPLLPWGYRNYNTHDKFSITTSEKWDAFSVCNNVSQADAPFFETYEIKDTPTVIATGEYDKKKASMDFVKKYPLKYLKLCVKRFIAYWGPITQKPSFIRKVIDTLVYIIVFPMAFYGFYRSKWWVNAAGTGFKPVLILLMTVILYYSILHTAVALDDNLVYRYPIIPLICIFSAYGYYEYFKLSNH